MKTKTSYIAILLLVFVQLFLLGACADDDKDNDSAGGGEKDDGSNDVYRTDDDDDLDEGDDDTNVGDDDADDTQPPVITTVTEIELAIEGYGPYSISARVTDEGGVDSVFLIVRIDGGDPAQTVMARQGDTNRYVAQIPDLPGGSSVEYYVEAFDASENRACDPATAPASVFSFAVGTLERLADDDGRPEACYNYANSYDHGSMVARAFTPGGYPSYLSSVQAALTSIYGDPDQIEVRVYADKTGGLPDDATLVWISGEINLTAAIFPNVDWLEFDVEADLAETPLTSGNWVIAVAQDPGWLCVGNDWSVHTWDPNSFYYHASTDTWGALPDVGGRGSFMFRASAYYF